MPISCRADESTPEGKRSLIRPLRGVPWWGVLAAYTVAIALGMLLSLFTKELGAPFAVVFILCAVACAVFAQRDCLFTATVMPVFGYTASYLVFYLASMAAAGQKGMKTAIIKAGVPFVSDVPVMLTAFGLTVAVVLLRIVLKASKEGWGSLWIVSLFHTKKEQKAAGAKEGAAEKNTPAAPHKGNDTTRQAGVGRAGASRAETNRAEGKRAETSQAEGSRAEASRIKASQAETAGEPPVATPERRATTPRPRPIAHTPSATIPRIAHQEGTYTGSSTASSARAYPPPGWQPEQQRRDALTPEERQRLAIIAAARRRGLDPRDPRVQREIARWRAALQHNDNGSSAPRRYPPSDGRGYPPAGRNTRAPYPQQYRRDETQQRKPYEPPYGRDSRGGYPRSTAPRSPYDRPRPPYDRTGSPYEPPYKEGSAPGPRDGGRPTR